jgi:hypothetical protein
MTAEVRTPCHCDYRAQRSNGKQQSLGDPSRPVSAVLQDMRTHTRDWSQQCQTCRTTPRGVGRPLRTVHSLHKTVGGDATGPRPGHQHKSAIIAPTDISAPIASSVLFARDTMGTGHNARTNNRPVSTPINPVVQSMCATSYFPPIL